MATLEDLERRVAALEAGHKTDIQALKRDLRRVLSLQDDMLEQLEELSRRVIANELAATANARATEAGFANVQAQFVNVHAQIGALDVRLGRVETELSALRRELPSMMAETMREVLREQRGA